MERPPKPERTLTMDDSTAASNPGRLPVNYLRWAWAFPLESGIFAALNLGLFGLALFVSPAYWFLFVPCALFTFLRLVRLREQFLGGCANPSVVVSVNPPLIAVCTDLRTGPTPYLVVKIIKQPLNRSKRGTPPIGTRVVTVALYDDMKNTAYGPGGHWSDVHPMAADCVSNNTALIDCVKETISEADWQELELALEQVPKPYCPGLYPVEVPETV